MADPLKIITYDRKSAAHQRMIEILKDALAKAEAGETEWVYLIESHRSAIRCRGSNPEDDTWRIVGMLEAAKLDYLKSMDKET